jgi:hypothetical protein
MATQDIAQPDTADGYVSEFQTVPVGNPPIPQS